jgi:hypothetical protein
VVSAGLTCASKCSALGSGLTVATAGVTRSFTLTARDAYDNQRDALDDSFVGRAQLDLENLPSHAPRESAVAFHSRFTPTPYTQLLAEGEAANPPSDPAGKYKGEYTATISGIYNLQVESADTLGKGLVAAYFVGTQRDYARHQTRVDSNIDFNWGLAAPDVNVAPGASFNCRWTGMLKPHISGGTQFACFTSTKVPILTHVPAEHTFFLETDGSASLTICNTLIVSGEDSNDADAEARSWAGTIALLSEVLYDIQVDYLHTSGPARMHLRWQCGGGVIQVVPSARLFAGRQIVELGQTRVRVRPALISALLSEVSGDGLSVCTAGMPASFAIVTRDAYGNMRNDPGRATLSLSLSPPPYLSLPPSLLVCVS